MVKLNTVFVLPFNCTAIDLSNSCTAVTSITELRERPNELRYVRKDESWFSTPLSLYFFPVVLLDKGMALYFSYLTSFFSARGYRSPNITEIASNGLAPGAHIIYLGNRDFIPEFSFQQDLGITTNFRNVSASLSIFNNNVQNYIYLTQLVDGNGNAIVYAQGNKTFQYQQAEAQLYGLEASLDVHPPAWKGFSFNNNIALSYGISKKKDYAKKGIEGEYLPLIPPAKLLSSIGQEIKTSPGMPA